MFLRNPNGNRYVLYLYWNDSQWNWNYNWLDNDWNVNNPSAVLARFIAGLSIPQVGEETARDLSVHFKTAEKFENSTAEELEILNGVGPVIAREIINWFNDKENKKTIEHLLKQVHIENVQPSGLHKLDRKVFVLTGTLPTLERDQVSEMIRANGGKVSSSVSPKTDYVLAGENSGEKLEKANELGVKVISESEFKNLLDI